MRKKKSSPLLLSIRCVALTIYDNSCNHGNSGNSLKNKDICYIKRRSEALLDPEKEKQTKLIVYVYVLSCRF